LIKDYLWNCLCKIVRTCTLLIIASVATISVAYGQTFTITTSPSSLTIYPGQQSVPITVTATSSTYTGPVSITMTGLPSGISVAPLTLTPGGSGTLLLNASVSAGQEGFSPTTLPSATMWTARVTVVGAVGAAQVTSSLPLTISLSNPAFAPSASAIDLPIVNINTSGVSVTSKTIDVAGTITITSPDGQTSYLPNSSDSDNTATFHVHAIRPRSFQNLHTT
jgi:hypothetical protein